MTAAPNPSPPSPSRDQVLLVTKREVANALSISTRTVDRMSATGQLSKVYIGNAVRFRWRDVLLLTQG